MAVAKYDDKAIKQLSGLEWARLRVESNFPTRGLEGLYKTITEITDNSIDECEQVLSPGNLVIVYLFLDKVNNTFQVMVKDNGRGIPHGAVLKSFTEMFTSGKYDRGENAAFTATGGLNGMGSVASSSTSKRFRAMVVRDSSYSSIYFKEGNINTLIHETNVPADPSLHGTTVILEPDNTIFYDFDRFIDLGYKHISKLCYLLSMFSEKTKFMVHIVEGSLDNKFWKMPVDKAYDYIERTYSKKAYLEVDGINKDAALSYLKELWQLNDSDKFTWELTDIIHKFDNTIGYNISIYLPKMLRNTNATMLMNNVVITDMTSSPITVLVDCLKNKLVSYVKDEYKEYFLTIYRLPVCCAISSRYIEVNFMGLAKTGFKSNKYAQLYEKYLSKDLDRVFEDDWRNLYELIAKDIETKYSVYYNKPLTKKSNKSSIEIIKPIYYDCKTSDRSQAELYIVEGISASHITDVRDPETQALLMIYGKPKNVLKVGNRSNNSINLFNSYEAYQTLEKILNIHPKQEDLSTANFGKIILMNDADIDGGHIQALHLGGLHTLNPRIIESGMVYISNPPLYEITFTGKNGKEQYKYIQDKNALIRFFIEVLYRNTFNIYVSDGNVFKEPTLLDHDSFTDFCYIITCIGEIFSNLSARLAAPPFVLEQLTHLTQYLQPNAIRGDKIAHALGRRTSYDKFTDILTVIGDKQDYSFSLEGVCSAFYEELLSYLRQIYWRDLKIYVSTKFTDTLNMKQVSITQLYEMFMLLTKQLEVTRQKGLGGMDEKDLYPLCINKETRVLHQITSLGDLSRIKALLGDDVTARKNILKEHSIQVD